MTNASNKPQHLLTTNFKYPYYIHHPPPPSHAVFPSHNDTTYMYIPEPSLKHPHATKCHHNRTRSRTKTKPKPTHPCIQHAEHPPLGISCTHQKIKVDKVAPFESPSSSLRQRHRRLAITTMWVFWPAAWLATSLDPFDMAGRLLFVLKRGRCQPPYPLLFPHDTASGINESADIRSEDAGERGRRSLHLLIHLTPSP